MNERIIDFVRSCPECQQNKSSRHQPYGLSSPLELPYAPWQSIAMDFIAELPISDGCDQLWVIIARFTKMAHFLTLRSEGQTAADLAVIFAREVWKYHGLPTDIVSDRDSRFTSETWKEFLRLSGIRSRMSTAFHPQTDGQTERLNQTIAAYIRAFVSKEQDNWAHLLPMAEFAYNNSTTTGNGMSPFSEKLGILEEIAQSEVVKMEMETKTAVETGTGMGVDSTAMELALHMGTGADSTTMELVPKMETGVDSMSKAMELVPEMEADSKTKANGETLDREDIDSAEEEMDTTDRSCLEMAPTIRNDSRGQPPSIWR